MCRRCLLRGAGGAANVRLYESVCRGGCCRRFARARASRNDGLVQFMPRTERIHADRGCSYLFKLRESECRLPSGSGTRRACNTSYMYMCMHTRESRVFQCAAARGAVSALHDPRSPAHPLRDTRIPMRRRAADTAACIDPLAPAARTLPHRTTTRPFTELRR